MKRVHLLGLNTLFISDMNPSNRSKGLEALWIVGHCMENFSSLINSTKAGAALDWVRLAFLWEGALEAGGSDS